MVIEATSGNTGIGRAMVCAQRGYPLVVVMGENFSVERRRMMRYLGAKVVLTPAAQRGTGMLGKAIELAAAHGWFLCRQFENEANPDMHSRTTAREILDDFAGERLAYRAIDLDAAVYQPDNRGGRVRAALSARTGVATIPQVFVGGTSIGGANETLAAWASGQLPQLLARHGVVYDTSVQVDPFSFLPGWMNR